MGEAINIFFLGKGGVGKSTSAALSSVCLAQKNFQVMIVSFDPAHNQSDIFEKNLSHMPRKIIPNLLGMEIDQDYLIKKYLKEIQNQIKKTYSYLTAFNLDRYFKVIKYSPGLEEYSLITAFTEIRNKFSDFDFLIFDMPPTALALKFFTLPFLSLVWVEQLLILRQEIIKKRDIITKIKLIKKEVERDKILNKINYMKKDYLDLKTIFEDCRKTHVNLVLNPDQLSLAESTRIFKTLQDININCTQIINNKMLPNSSCYNINKAFATTPIHQCPYSEIPLISIRNLNNYLELNSKQVEEQINYTLKIIQEDKHS